MKIPFFQVDAFSDKPFSGNPAAVCLVDEVLTDSQMQSIAAENNISETAFVMKQENGFGLRWFTPKVEVPLCGHATLASSHILFQEKIASENETIKFHTKSGLLTATKKENWIELDLPALPGFPVELPAAMLNALKINPIKVVIASGHYLAEVENEQIVRNLDPDFNTLVHYESIIVTAQADKESPYDFVSRYFAPSYGVNEDPVTGSAHCCLAPYWAARLGKKEFFAYQASTRSGEIKMRINDDRVFLAGKTKTVITGTFTI
jgi:PhzF family phenazine biosynthesis protein